MPQRTLYRVLMVDPSATGEVITAAYRVLAKRYHPDRDSSPTAAERMVELNEAYRVLKDRTSRAAYNEMLGDQLSGHARPTAPGAINTRYDNGSWTVRETDEPMPRNAQYGEAGPPPPFPAPTGNILTFGRYRGWSVAQVAARDRNYLEWLQRTQAGRTYARELETVLGLSPT